MAGWTAEGGALGVETGGRNKYYWTVLHSAKQCRDRNKGIIQRYQTIMCSYSEIDESTRNDRAVITIMRIETILG
jgi:hypothetical protein